MNLARLLGSNANEIQRRMPHIASLLRATPCDVLDRSEVVVASQQVARLADFAPSARAEQWVIDVNGWEELKALPWAYEGMCW